MLCCSAVRAHEVHVREIKGNSEENPGESERSSSAEEQHGGSDGRSLRGQRGSKENTRSISHIN